MTVLGHVDHGKTSLLDAIRDTRVAAGEPGRITQHVGASEVPLEVILQRCVDVLSSMKITFTIPGLLFIDTPGHEVFANLRKRGGSVADIAILVVDLMQGIQQQTVEALSILREYKTPFVVAATKVDLLTGWVPARGCFPDVLKAQRPAVVDALDAKLYELVGALYQHGFSAERFDRVGDFTKQVVVVPVSSKTGEGIPELLMFVAGLAQKFLEKRLEVHDAGKGSVLEVKEEKGLGKTIDVILYDGSVSQGDTVVFASSDGVISSKVKALLKPAPLQEMRNAKKFDSVSEVFAACGVKVACEGAENALPGSTIMAVKDAGQEARAREEVAGEVKEILVEKEVAGIIVEADALGSVEAITKLFEAEGVPIRRAGVGRVAKKHVAEAASVGEKNPFLGAVFAFNVPVEDEARALAEQQGVKVFEENIIYNLVEGYKRWVEEEKAREKREAFLRLTMPAKLIVLPGCCFRANNPAIFGVEVAVGTIRKKYSLMNEEGVLVGEIKQIQVEKKAVDEARQGQQVAVSMDGPTYGRQVFEKQALFTDVSKDDAKVLEEKYLQALSPEEKALLKEIKKIKGFSLF